MQLYDPFGKEIEIQKRPDDRVLAVASLRDKYSNYPSNGLTPSKLASIFKEADAGDVYSQMELFEEMEEKDTHLFSILQTRKLSVAGLDFEVAPFSEENKDKTIADFAARNIYRIADFEDNLLDMCDAIGKGYSALEIYWALKDGKNIIRHLEFVPQKKFAFTPSPSPLPQGERVKERGGFIAPRLITDDNYSGIDLPPFKFIFHQHKAKTGHPTRQGVIRVCAWLYLFKNYSIKDWVAFAEVFGMPLRLGKYDPSASKEDKEALISAVRSLGTDAAGIISKSTEIQFIEAVKNSGRDVYEVLASFCNSEMSKAVLGQTLTTQQGESGSYSLGQVHDRVRRDLLQADCEALAKTIRRDLIRPLIGFNFGWDANLPWFKFHYEEPQDLKAEAEKIEILARAGAGKTIPAKWVNEKFNIPAPEDGEETLGINPPQSPFEKGGSEAGGFASQANKACPSCGCMVNKAGAQFTPEQQSIEGLVDRAVNQTEDALKENEEKILKAIEGAESFEDAIQKVLELYPEMDMDRLSGILERSSLMAGIFGKWSAESKLK